MTKKQPDMRRDALLRRALIPKGHRPTTDADVDKLLDTVSATPLSQEQFERMLQKINGTIPTFRDRFESPPILTTELSEAERELVALYRAQNKPLPSDLAAKVLAMEQKVVKPPTPPEERPGA